MLCPACCTRVPFLGKRPDAVKMRQFNEACGAHALGLAVPAKMLRWMQADQIRRVVVIRIEIGVVDVIASRDRTVVVLPDRPMQQDTSAAIILLIFNALAVGITPECAAVEDDSLPDCHGAHNSSSSAYCKASARTHPRFSVQIR